ncbi:iron ABC transporter ATP-binding protein [Spirochaetia bacterium]|nr:iron ABC transporter ATP-binding protein [Spirochaetia bacterium]
MLEVKNGAFSFGDKLVFENISFSVEPGDVFAVLGRNGAGKTTLLKCIMNLLRWTKGAAFLNGHNIDTIPQRILWRSIAYVPQARSGVDFSAREMIVLGRSSYIGTFNTPKEEDYAIADGIIQRLYISHLADKMCSRLSGGELQLVLIARALTAQPKLLILDEPESNLDYHNQLHVLSLIREISQTTACILNTHYPEHALRFANKSLLLRNNGAPVVGATADVVSETNLSEAFKIDVHIGEKKIDGAEYKYIIPLHPNPARK